MPAQHAAAKTVIATGASSGLGFEAVKQLLLHQTQQSYRFIVGARDTKRTVEAYDALKYDADRHSLTVLPLELSDLRTVKRFAQQAIKHLDEDGAASSSKARLDYLFLNAALAKSASGPGVNGSKWSEIFVVNHLSQHYLIHLLKDRLIESHSRVVVVSSGAIRMVSSTDGLAESLKAGGNKEWLPTYAQSKFVQLVGALYWRRQLAGKCDVLAVSPGMIPGTGLGRHADSPLNGPMPDGKSVPEGAQSILRAFSQEILADASADDVFLTSWGEWWLGKEIYPLALDRNLQDSFCPDLQSIEQEESTD